MTSRGWKEIPKIPYRRVSGPSQASDHQGLEATRQLYPLTPSEDKSHTIILGRSF